MEQLNCLQTEINPLQSIFSVKHSDDLEKTSSESTLILITNGNVKNRVDTLAWAVIKHCNTKVTKMYISTERIDVFSVNHSKN